VKPGWRVGFVIFAAGYTVERIGTTVETESIYRRPMGGNAL
jgi:hypothetical protein